MKKLAILIVFALQAEAYAQIPPIPPGQSTPQQRVAMMEQASSDRQQELLREQTYERLLKQQAEMIKQLLDIQRSQLALQQQQLDVQRQQVALQQRLLEKK